MLTVLSAAILIGAEVFGAAFAGGWAIANLLEWGTTGEHIMQGIFFLCGIAVMVALHPQRAHASSRSRTARVDVRILHQRLKQIDSRGAIGSAAKNFL